MNTIYVEVGNEGSMLHFICERRSGVAITFPDGVWITTMPVPPGSEIPAARTTKKPPLDKSSFPPRDLTEAAIVQVLAERSGTVKIRQDDWNIYDELAARLGVSFEARQRPTEGTGRTSVAPGSRLREKEPRTARDPRTNDCQRTRSMAACDQSRRRQSMSDRFEDLPPDIVPPGVKIIKTATAEGENVTHVRIFHLNRYT